MRLSLYQVDAFADRPFAGNPAAVVPLDAWLPETLMQAIAAENNLSETAFFVVSASDDADFRIRWFTPAREVPLCGHATIASAAVLRKRLGMTRWPVRFLSRSGVLTVGLDNERYVLDSPADPPERIDAPAGLSDALGASVTECWLGKQGHVVLFEREQDVRDIRPNFALLTDVVERAIVTAPGDRHDFVSRFFAPALGIDEDPVTGAAHCTLAAFWAGRLGRTDFCARQVSERGGDVECAIDGDRVLIKGSAAFYLEGEIELPDRASGTSPAATNS